MSVIQKVVFCEGEKGKLDSQLLLRLKPPDVAVVPAGGKFTFSIFAKGYFAGEKDTKPKYLVFRDRDFDITPTEQNQLLHWHKMLLSHRSCIENYLLDPQLIHAYWQAKHLEKLENPTAKWGHRDSPGVEKLSQWIELAARKLRDYQATRWALADLVNDNAARVQLKTTWTKNSGELPNSLTLKACHMEAINLIQQFREAIAPITEQKFETSLATYKHQFEQKQFWLQHQYLIWFQGKDMQRQMQKDQNHYPGLDGYFRWAVNQVDYRQYPDLLELQRQMELL